RGRSLLRARLMRRGLGPAAFLVAAACPTVNASATLPAAIVLGTIKAASLCTSGQGAASSVISAKVAALTQRVLKAMLFCQLKTAVILIAAIAVVSLGLGLVTLAGNGWAGSSTRQEEKKPPANPSTARTLRLPDTPFRYADVDLPAHFKTP